MTLDYKNRCGAKTARPPDWKLDRFPICNRPGGHRGEHIEYDRKTGERKAVWTDEQCRQS